MHPRTWTAVAASGAILLGVAAFGLLPMIEESLAVRAVRSGYRMERLEAVGPPEDAAAFRCGEVDITVADDPTSAGSGSPRVRLDRPGWRIVTIGIGPRSFETPAPVPVNAAMSGANRYWNSVAAFRWSERETGRAWCGVAHTLPSDTAAVRRARTRGPRTAPGLVLANLRGDPAPYMHGLRFRVLRWEKGGSIEGRAFGYGDWRGDPFGTQVANLFWGAIGMKNQSVYYWPSLLFPVLYPLGTALLGAALLGVGVVGRIRAGVVPMLAAALLFGPATPVAAQNDAPPGVSVAWSLLDAVGYGGLGFGLGLMATWDLEGEGFGPPGTAVALIAATTVAATTGGAVLGARARSAVAQGRGIGGGHRTAVVAGALLGGPALGALAAIPLINNEGEGTVLGSDERTLALMMIGGGLAASWFVLTHRDELSSRSVRVAPARFGEGRYGLRVRVGDGSRSARYDRGASPSTRSSRYWP